MWASQVGHVEVVDRLLQHGAGVDLQDEVKQLYNEFMHSRVKLLIAIIVLNLFVFSSCTNHRLKNRSCRSTAVESQTSIPIFFSLCYCTLICIMC